MVVIIVDDEAPADKIFIPLDFKENLVAITCDNEIINKIAKMFPQIQDKEYLEELVKREREKLAVYHISLEDDIRAHLVNGFKVLKKKFFQRFPTAEKKRNYYINDIFQKFKENIMEDKNYEKQAINTLCGFLGILPSVTIEKVFLSNRKSFFISAADLRERIDSESDPPKFNGETIDEFDEEFNEPDTNTLNKPLRIEVENAGKDPDDLNIIIDILNKQMRALSYPPLPPKFNHIPDIDALPKDTPTMTCHRCGKQTPTETVGCCNNNNPAKLNARGYQQCLMCHDCILETIRNSYPNLKKRIVTGGVELCKRYSEVENVTIHDIPCFTTGHQISASLILIHTTVKQQAVMRGIPLASQFNQSTVQSGLCAKCLYPLIPTWKDDGVWICGNTECKCVYFIDIGDWAK